jgi:hypothetical protein
VSDEVTRAYETGAMTPPAGEVAIGGRRPDIPDLVDGLRRASRWLIGYGVVGLAVAVVGFGILLYADGRIAAATDRVEASMSGISTTLERTATALRDASTTAGTFSDTLDRTEAAVSSAADTIIGVRTNLETLRDVLRAVNILGVTPLGPASDAVGGIAGAIEGLDSRLTTIADSLATNDDSLAANATSLGRLGDSTAALAERLRSGVVEDSLADVHLAILAILLVLTVWTVLPAAGALAAGVWLRRLVRESEG